MTVSIEREIFLESVFARISKETQSEEIVEEMEVRKV